MSSKLLPPDQGFHVEAIADAHDSEGRLTPSLDLIPHVGKDLVPAGWMPWLLRNAGLERLMPFVDWDVLWSEGPAWLRLRGTPAASVIAAGWLGWNIQFEDGAAGTALYDHYHIHLPDVPDLVELKRIIGVERIAKSTDSRFFRLVHGYDIRPVRGGHTRYGRHIWARHSGVELRPDWPRLSFRLKPVLHVSVEPRAWAAETLRVDGFAPRRGHVVHARSRRPERASPGPIWSLQFSDSTKANAGAQAHSADQLRPIAGLVGGCSRIASRQAVYMAMRNIAGERPVRGAMKAGAAFRLPRTIQLMRVPDSVQLPAFGLVGATVLSRESIPVGTFAGPVNPTAHADATGLMTDGARATLDGAPWSGLPWGGDWGEAPRALAHDTTEID